MRPHYFFTSVTRNSDLWQRPFEVEPLALEHWSTGDFVAGRVTGERNRLYMCETKTGRMADMVRGDLLIGALGQRAATLEGVGNWTAVGEDLELDALTGAGLLGKATSISPMLPELMRLEYRGHVTRNGEKLTIEDFVTEVPPRKLDIPLVLLIGTSMSSGKTSSGQVIIRALTYLGLRVVAGKLTGAARYRDILKFRDSGAIHVFDFVDAGLSSTVCSESRYREALEVMISKIAACEADILVAEAGASPLEPYNGSVVVDHLRDQTCFTVLCASDPYAVLGVKAAFGDELRADIVAGPAANTNAGIQLVKELTGLPALNLLDRKCYPVISDMLKRAIEPEKFKLAQ